MSREKKLSVLPIKLAWAAVVLALVFIASQAIPGASAQQAPCRGEIINDVCVLIDEVDVCWNLDGAQASVPPGYHQDASQNNACVEDVPVPPGEVLGAQVLAESTGK